jgi:DNA polymerase III alpha subunit
MQVKFVTELWRTACRSPVIEKFWKDLLGFADYCFNKITLRLLRPDSYQTAYLKAHYPAAFMAALMTSDYDDTDRLAIEIAECKKMGIKVLPPDVDESFHEFAVVLGDQPDNRKAPIRFGMDAIKNVGSGAVDEIIRAREENGRFDSLERFYVAGERTRVVNRKAFESLIKAGALDRFGDRSTLLHNLDMIMAYGQRLAKERASGQTDLFGNIIDDATSHKPTLKLDTPAVKHNGRELLVWERELLGLYLSQQPLDAFSTLLAEQTVPLNSLKPEFDGKPVTVGGIVLESARNPDQKRPKNGIRKARRRIRRNRADLVPQHLPADHRSVGARPRYYCGGKINAKDRDGNIGTEVKMLVDDGREVTHEQAVAYQGTGRKQREIKVAKRKGTALQAAVAAAKADRATISGPGAAAAGTVGAKPSRVYIRLVKSDDHAMLAQLKTTIDAQQGDSEVVLVLGPDTAKQAIKLPTRMSSDTAALERLQSLVGAGNVVLQ